MAKFNFDDLDLFILNALKNNARKPYLEIARECGVSGAAIHQRIQRLTQAGIITGFKSVIDPESVGYNTCAYVGLFLRNPSDFPEVVEKLRRLPEVVECHVTTGEYDVFIKLYARNNDHLLHLIQNELQSLGTSRTETMISFNEVFSRQVPIDPYLATYFRK